MLEIFNEIQIDRPIKEVVAFASDPDNAPLWYENIRAVCGPPYQALAEGSQIVFVSNFMGALSYNYEVTELSDTFLKMWTMDAGFPMYTSYTWSAVAADRTKMCICSSSEPKGFVRLLSPVVAMMTRRDNQKALLKLKKILENREPSK